VFDATMTDPYVSRTATEDVIEREDPVVWPGGAGPLGDAEVRDYERTGFAPSRRC